MPIHAEGKFTTVDVWRGRLLMTRKYSVLFSVVGFLFLALATFLSIFSEQGW